MEAIPADQAQWKVFAKKEGISNTSIYNLEDYVSASKIGTAQYLSVRSFWSQKGKKIDPEEVGILDVAEAAKWLNSRSDWKGYLDSLNHPNAYVFVPELGTFSFSSFAHRQIARVREVDEREKVNFTPMKRRLRSWNTQKDNLIRQDAQMSPLANKGKFCSSARRCVYPSKIQRA